MGFFKKSSSTPIPSIPEADKGQQGATNTRNKYNEFKIRQANTALNMHKDSPIVKNIIQTLKNTNASKVIIVLVGSNDYSSENQKVQVKGFIDYNEELEIVGSVGGFENVLKLGKWMDLI